MKLLRARERQQRRPDPAETETDPWRLGLRGSRASGWPLVLRAGWAWMDLNHRPLPYQGSALTELSYRPAARPHEGARPGKATASGGVRRSVALLQRDFHATD